MVRCFLVLEDGTALEGVSFGHVGAVTGEIVFTTCMSGYQESITDPAYKGQILVSAFPLVGDYGVSERYDASGTVHVAALVVRECCREPSNMYGGRTLDDYLKEHKVPGISGIDTRDVISAIRNKGSMKAAIVCDEKAVNAAKKKLKGDAPAADGLVSYVSAKKIKKIGNGKKMTVGIIDCGIDRGMVRDISLNYNVIIFPHDTDAKKIIASKTDCVIVSGGPGSPDSKDVAVTVNTVKEISSSVPVAGTGLGSQIIAKAFGCSFVKLKFGHHGPSQPVKHGERVYITSQNHMYAIDPGSMKGTGLAADQFNVNDGTVEGFTHTSLPVFGVNYRPLSPLYDEDSYFYGKLEKIMGVIE
ncbi:MAG: glutamine-hydrolyzing carbamoyl-phosphate synthase small subunit [Methanomassiliicoccaceae archaeon]|nr:glutamine-hydrolyzing carbamoyl-phosphate synthase small subunit [Methanomassiliicoccaceae archaeon]